MHHANPRSQFAGSLVCASQSDIFPPTDENAPRGALAGAKWVEFIKRVKHSHFAISFAFREPTALGGGIFPAIATYGFGHGSCVIKWLLNIIKHLHNGEPDDHATAARFESYAGTDHGGSTEGVRGAWLCRRAY